MPDTMGSSTALPLPDARRDLLTSLIDDGRLLGPDQPSLDDAVAAYRAARAASSGMLGSLLCPASQLIELSGSLVKARAGTTSAWPITVVLDGDLGAAATAERAFSATMEPAAKIVLAALPAPMGHAAAGPAEAASAATAMTAPVAALVDVTAEPASDPAALARLLSELGRSGGSLVARNVDAVVRTADRPGVLNVVAAAAFAAAREAETTVAAVLTETDADALRLGRAGLTWRRRSIGSADLRRVRSGVVRSLATSRPSTVLADLDALWCSDMGRNQ